MNKTVFLSIIISAAVCLSGCGVPKSTPVTFSGLYYDTVISIDIYGAPKDSETICAECERMCERYEALFDKNMPGSDIYRINHSDGAPVKVDHDTAVLISKALEYSKLSDGLFDVSIAPVSALWDFHDDPRIPSDEEIAAALPLVDHTKVLTDLTNDTVTVGDSMSLDLGGAAKGYIADRIGEYLMSCSITGAIINMGGDIKILGTKPDKSMFNIGINDPFNDGGVLMSLGVSDTSVATSGIYERCFVKDGISYHHILDPKTGRPVKTDIESVTVITKSAVDADCLCTLAILYGSDKAMELIENTENTEAVILLTDGSVLSSSKASDLIRQ